MPHAMRRAEVEARRHSLGLPSRTLLPGRRYRLDGRGLGPSLGHGLALAHRLFAAWTAEEQAAAEELLLGFI